MHVSIRHYDGLDPDAIDEIVRRAKEGFLPIVKSVPGFVGYYIVDAGGGAGVTISIFETEAATEESNRKAADWIKANMAELVSSSPKVTVGEARLAE